MFFHPRRITSERDFASCPSIAPCLLFSWARPGLWSLAAMESLRLLLLLAILLQPELSRPVLPHKSKKDHVAVDCGMCR
ncbi:hypothetical protein NDU88_004781 [Pleurodeles waltl]|uniref:Secreted protein n=1 Tax=Pleurodeles waltl TaxID=8319 RepID=A0AAV7PKS9_PLEWA|nr:hypothetical protein NDU88_004781 [Pleurodeles waltl]